MTQQAVHETTNKSDRRKWVALLEDLAAGIEKWSAAEGWEVKRKTMILEEEALGTYEAPELHIRKGRRTLVVEPVARYVTGGEGLVVIRGKEPFKRLLLARKKGAWKVYTEERIPWPESWNKSAFLKIAEALTPS